MSESAFDTLLEILYPKLQRNDIMPNNSIRRVGGVITPKVTMTIEIYPLAGAKQD